MLIYHNSTNPSTIKAKSVKPPRVMLANYHKNNTSKQTVIKINDTLCCLKPRVKRIERKVFSFYWKTNCYGVGQRLVAGSCEQTNKSLVSIKVGGFLDYRRDSCKFEGSHPIVYGQLFVVLVPLLHQHIKSDVLLQLVTFGYMFRTLPGHHQTYKE